MGNWAELPQDALLLILQKLIIGKDYYRFACVCRPWTSAAVNYLKLYAPAGSPCLIVPDTDMTLYSKSRRLLLLASPVGKDIAKEEDFLPEIRLPLLEKYIGSYQGWLAILKRRKTIYLLNPFSDTRIDLPVIWPSALYTLPTDPDDLYLQARAVLIMSEIWESKVILSTIPTASNCFVLLIYRYQKLAFCKVGDKGWTFIGAKALRYAIQKISQFFMDAIYFKGQFFVVSARGEIFCCDPTVSKPSLTKIYANDFHTNPPIPPVLSHHLQPLWYLVQCRGRLFRIRQDIEEVESRPLDQIYYWTSYRSYRFEVCKLDTRSGSKPSWTHVDNFEGDAVFLGLNQSFSLSNPHEFGYKENRIYFTHHRSVNNDMGVFNLDDCTVEPLYNTNSWFIRPSPIWVIPKPKMFVWFKAI